MPGWVLKSMNEGSGAMTGLAVAGSIAVGLFVAESAGVLPPEIADAVYRFKLAIGL